jgi:hypothetical protein
MCFSKCFSPCGGFGGNPCDQKREQFVVLKLVFLTHVIVLVTTHVIRSGAVCAFLSVFHLVVVLVTTREACTVCGSLAGVFPPCDCFSYNPRDQKGEECVSLSVFFTVWWFW